MKKKIEMLMVISKHDKFAYKVFPIKYPSFLLVWIMDSKTITYSRVICKDNFDQKCKHELDTENIFSSNYSTPALDFCMYSCVHISLEKYWSF